ncbi:hypothetical protein SELMODRAFT_89756 [Selaginella moellendorffii]|uniref:glucan endo-1,3-beta-D-glucosidase n=2 Tax=Selaginella moellendorffii TaxID=88036 RepID=D8RBA6_SELML|nr:hypothetical protein SELMODRAFT_89756 [Selaginella moellendorffii]
MPGRSRSAPRRACSSSYPPFSPLVLSIALTLVTAMRLGSSSAVGFGVNWGNMASHRLPAEVVLRMLSSSNITKLKLFDADSKIVGMFANSDVELMVGIPNEMLDKIANSPRAALDWVKENVTQHLPEVKIRYVAVGNEPFLKAYNATYESVTLPALRNIQGALDKLNSAEPIKAVVPLNADVLSDGGSPLPSAGLFRPDIQPLMDTLVLTLAKHQAPFVVNIYPFLSLHQDPHFPQEFAFFDGSNTGAAAIHDFNGNTYTNVFDASYDLLVAALNRNGFPDMKIIVGEVGWPTDGDVNANPANAQRFNQGLLAHITSGRGTPLRPNQELDVYLFALIDEDQKSILPGNFERHWGIYTYDGRAKYELDVLGTGLANFSSDVQYLPWRWCVLNPEGDMTKLAKSVDYACSHGDCTALVYGGSCNHIGDQGNASYAFNSYYQINNQEEESCVFDGLGMITTANPSTGGCEFPVQLNPLASSSTSSTATLMSSESSSVGQSMLLALLLAIAQLVLDFDKLASGWISSRRKKSKLSKLTTNGQTTITKTKKPGICRIY